MQYLLITPFFVILYYKKPKIGIYLILVFILFTSIVSISPKILFGIEPYLQIIVHGTTLLTKQIKDSFNWYHTTPNVYFVSYFIGIGFGFLVNKNIKFSRRHENLFWTLSIISVFTMYYWNNTFFRSDHYIPVWSALLWHSIGKIFFGLSTAWIFYAICTGRGG